MKAKHVVATLERVAAVAVEIESCAARHENLLSLAAVVEESLQESTPASIFVNFVEDPEARWRQLAVEDGGPMLRHVPVEIAAFRAGDMARESGLADLSWTRDENHLPLQIGANLRVEVANLIGQVGTMLTFSTTVKNDSRDFCSR